MNMNEEMELLNFEEDIEEIQKCLPSNQYDFPVVSVSKNGLYLNYWTQKIIDKIGMNAVRFFTTTNYVILVPCKKGQSNAFSLCNSGNANGNYKWIGMPKALEEKKIKPGSYRLYKCKQGFCFKRYEPLTEV